MLDIILQDAEIRNYKKVIRLLRHDKLLEESKK